MTIAADEALSPQPLPNEVLICQVEEWGRIEIPAAAILRDGRLDVFPAVLDHDYFSLRAHASGVTLQAGRYIGVIPLNDRLTIEVAPRVPVSNFTRLLEVSRHLPTELRHAIRRYDTEQGMLPSLAVLYARALVGYVDEILFQGLHKEYVRREADTSYPKGRIAIGRTVNHLMSSGITHRVSAEWFERTVDNGPNRALKFALWYLVQLLQRSHDFDASHRSVITSLNRAYRALDAVSLDLSQAFLRDDIVSERRLLPPLRSYYRDALDLARAVIRDQSITWDRPGDTLRLPSLVLDMSSIFEAYLLRLLKLAAAADSWPATVLDGNKSAPVGGGKLLFDSGSPVRATPDIVMAKDQSGERTYPTLIEVKYKPAPDRDDINQTIAYAVSYRCENVVIAQPKAISTGLQPGLSPLGKIDSYSVYRYVFDLGADDLSDEEDQFVQSILAMSTSNA